MGRTVYLYMCMFVSSLIFVKVTLVIYQTMYAYTLLLGIQTICKSVAAITHVNEPFRVFMYKPDHVIVTCSIMNLFGKTKI